MPDVNTENCIFQYFDYIIHNYYPIIYYRYTIEILLIIFRIIIHILILPILFDNIIVYFNILDYVDINTEYKCRIHIIRLLSRFISKSIFYIMPDVNTEMSISNLYYSYIVKPLSQNTNTIISIFYIVYYSYIFLFYILIYIPVIPDINSRIILLSNISDIDY